MTTTVEFSGLGLTLEINRVAFSIGSFPIYWYGIIIGFGLALAMVWAFWKSKEFGIDGDKFIDVVIVGAIVGVFGARLFYVLFSEPGQFKSVGDFFDFRNGGLLFYGALIFGMLAAYFISRWRKIKFFPMADLVAVGFMIGQCIGRWGNFLNQEAFGTNTDLPWGMFSSYTKHFLQQNQMGLLDKGIIVDPMAAVHPTFLYESLWLLVGFILISLYLKRRKFDGEIFLMYIAWNGFGRAFIEGLRTDSMYLGSLRVSQVLATVGAIAAIGLIVWTRIKIVKASDEKYLMPYAYTEEWAQEYAAILVARETEKHARDNKKSAVAGGCAAKTTNAAAKNVVLQTEKPKEITDAQKADITTAQAQTKAKKASTKAESKSTAKTAEKESKPETEITERAEASKNLTLKESAKPAEKTEKAGNSQATDASAKKQAAKNPKPEKADSDPALPTGEILDSSSKAETHKAEKEEAKTYKADAKTASSASKSKKEKINKADDKKMKVKQEAEVGEK